MNLRMNRSSNRCWRWILIGILSLGLADSGHTQGFRNASGSPSRGKSRMVKFPPVDAPPPPRAKAPPKTKSAGEPTDVLPGFGAAMAQKQERETPPPTNLTVMYKVQYGEKLQYALPDGRIQEFDQWQSFPADASSLVQATNLRLKDGNNYQYATKALKSPGFDPLDIPILYMTGDYDFEFTPQEVEHLRKYITEGGTIIFNAARGLDEFSAAVAREMRKLFPQKNFMRLSPDHPVFNSMYRIQNVLTLVNGVQFSQPPEVYSIDIGTRAAAILVPAGLGAAWSSGTYHPAGKHVVGEPAIRLGVNLIAYVLASTQYGRFLAQEFPVYQDRTRAGDLFRYAIVQYSGSWDVNPGLQNSVLKGLNDNTKINVDYKPNVVALDDPELGNYPLIFMTGHYNFQLTPQEVSGLAHYLQRGGLLVASAAAGFKPFDLAFRREMKKVFSNMGGVHKGAAGNDPAKTDLIKLPPTHPLFTGGWNAMEKVAYTPYALKDDPRLEYPDFYGVFLEDRLVVLYTPYDFKGALNRESNAYSKGLDSNDALRVAINIITYALSH